MLATLATKGSGDDQLSSAADLAVDADYVYVADQSVNRIKVWAKDGTHVLTYGGGGSTPGRFQGPVGLDLTPDGLLYVTEFTNERVQVLQVGDGTGDTTAPDTAVTAPVDGATVAAGPVAIAGTASDDVSVAAVDIAVQDAASKAWLRPDGKRGGFAWLPAQTSGTGTAVTWTDEADLPAGRYGITARATDAAGNRDTTRPWQRVTARDGSGDTTAPDTAITEPANGATVAAGPVAISGTASDDVSVAAVDYAIQDAASKAWLRPDGSWRLRLAARPDQRHRHRRHLDRRGRPARRPLRHHRPRHRRRRQHRHHQALAHHHRRITAPNGARPFSTSVAPTDEGRRHRQVMRAPVMFTHRVGHARP